MLAKVMSAAIYGLDAILVEVEVDVSSRGLPTLTIVGLPDKAVDEARDRVKTAIINSSFEMPDSRITVNLAPADIPKEGSGFDLPIAIGILAASGAINAESLINSIFIGELSLEGKIRKIPGAISISLLAKNLRLENIFVPQNNAKEAALVDDLNIFEVRELKDAILHLNQQVQLSPFISEKIEENKVQNYEYDFKDIKNQRQAKRALEIAAAGFHNLHLKGPPGAGKTMLCRAFPSILPPLEKDEMLEVLKIYSVCGFTKSSNFSIERPFRFPHHTTSRNGLIGGGTRPRPGEISLAHRGVLFLDEFAEFPRSTLEALRQPLEDGVVTISRALGSMIFPCRFILLAASNPCPCGFLGHPKKQCSCLPGIILKYKKRLSGPVLDRIDLHVDVPPVTQEKLSEFKDEEESKKVRDRVIQAHNIQKERFENEDFKTNSQMNPSDVKKYCNLPDESLDLLKNAISRLTLSARSYFKILKISQTIADLEKSEKIKPEFIAEALQYRSMEDY